MLNEHRGYLTDYAQSAGAATTQSVTLDVSNMPGGGKIVIDRVSVLLGTDTPVTAHVVEIIQNSARVFAYSGGANIGQGPVYILNVDDGDITFTVTGSSNTPLGVGYTAHHETA